MNLMDLLDSTGGQKSLASLTDGLGLDSAKTSQLLGALTPALLGGLQKQAASQDGLAGLKKAIGSGNHQRYIDNPELISADETRVDGNNILGHLLGSKDVSRKVADQAAESTGLDSALIKKALPLIAGLAMGAVSKSSKGGQSLDSSLGGLLGNLLGGDGELGLDDVMGFAKKLF
jgi:hypothetical protein